jgi:hypothetical protein
MQCNISAALYFICGLFNDVVSSTDYTASNDRHINEKWIGKRMKKAVVISFKILSQHFPG